ncbi:MAG TPA: hypothetical protein VLJ42_11060 [Solirubrobacteraceae bacterium]|nr:hypothetical protein [Solirubrobacteraceae bacterium]
MSSPAQPPRFQRFERVGLVSASALVALNIWTGCPLLALWIGSRLVGGDGLSMGAVFVVVIALSALELAMTIALTWMSTRYDERIARRFDQRRSSPWLRSMRGEREELIKGRLGVTPIEWVMMISVALAVITLETWFFFFAGSPLVG